MRRLQFAALLLAAAIPALSQEFPAASALQGYDPVAYFTTGAATPGDATMTAEHQGATYRFSTREHLAAFRKDPARYLPQFAGQCAWAVSKNYLYPGDPTAFTVYQGRLYLNANQDISRKFNSEIDRLVPLADKNWPGLQEKFKSKQGR